MTTLTVEIDRVKDLPALQALLNRLGLKYTVTDDEWVGLSDAEVKGIQAGLEDYEAGRVHSASDVKAHMDRKISILRSRDV